ncbi:YfiR family protein [Paucibacter sp. O1-1]|nr:YfiR family protein [Paucibacter sp. O1-1]MDA3831264.1 YfiR family protein [Paucibacter sp. O1-1]
MRHPRQVLAWRSRRCIALLVMQLVGAAAPALAQASGPAAPESLKAEIVFRALMFVSWPGDRISSGKGLQLCTLGDGRMDTALLALGGRMIRQQGLETRRARLDQLGGCHAIYLAAPNPSIIAALSGRAVLLVSDTTSTLADGVMLNLQVEDGRVVFDIELDAARRAGLDISAKLLRLARFVKHSAP